MILNFNQNRFKKLKIIQFNTTKTKYEQTYFFYKLVLKTKLFFAKLKDRFKNANKFSTYLFFLFQNIF